VAIGNNCKICEKLIKTNQYGACCSSGCKKASMQKNSNNIKKNCQKCCIEFFCIKSKSDITRFCSWECRKSETSKACEECGAQFLVTSVNHIRKRFCSAKCARGGKKSHFYGLKGELSYTFGQTPWTKGKSAKDNEKIAAAGRKISFKLKQKFKNGELSNSREKNPMFGKTWNKEQKERASIMVTERMKRGEWNTKHPKFICGHYESAKMNTKFWYRSSLELRIMKCFEIDSNVSSYFCEPLSIVYGENKRYVPDFICKFLDDTIVLCECKPKFQLEMKGVQLKTAAAQKMCKENGWQYKIYTLEDVKEYEAKLELVNKVEE
jgi:hypothetical protein